MFYNIQKNLELIQGNENKILDMWMDYRVVQESLARSNFDIGFFREKFASKVLHYAMSVAKSESSVGNCPVMGVLLMLFKRKNIPLSDIFIICVHLKNAMIHFLNQKNLLTDDMISEISMIMDYNFEGVIKEYVLMYYKAKTKTVRSSCTVVTELNDEEKSFTPEVQKVFDSIPKQEVKESVTETVPEPETKKVTSAQEYLMDIDLDYEMVAELDELESEVLDAIYSTEIITPLIMEESSQLFEQYSKVLNTLYEFEELSYTLTILKDLLLTTDLNSMDDETKEMVGAYLRAIIGDLNAWRMAVFITCQAEDIHYLDKTLLSSIAQLQITLLPQDHDTEDEIEFF